jgi:hypothetical protein
MRFTHTLENLYNSLYSFLIFKTVYGILIDTYNGFVFINNFLRYFHLKFGVFHSQGFLLEAFSFFSATRLADKLSI